MRYPERIELKTTPELRQRLQDVAASQRRSVNNLINVLLWDAVWGPLAAPMQPRREPAGTDHGATDPNAERADSLTGCDDGHVN